VGHRKVYPRLGKAVCPSAEESRISEADPRRGARASSPVNKCSEMDIVRESNEREPASYTWMPMGGASVLVVHDGV